MNDTIYRQQAIDTIKALREVAWKNWHEPTLSPNMVIDALSGLPSAPLRTVEWIPVTEKLPEKTQLCLVTEKTVVGFEVCTRCFNKRGDGGFWSGWGYTDVLAWMPLPQPYTEETNA